MRIGTTILFPPNDTRYQSGAAAIQKNENPELCVASGHFSAQHRNPDADSADGDMRVHDRGWHPDLASISPKAITRQIMLENYIIGLPAFAVSLPVSLAVSSDIRKLIEGILQDVQLASYISPMHAAFLLIGAAIVIFIAVLLASFRSCGKNRMIS